MKVSGLFKRILFVQMLFFLVADFIVKKTVVETLQSPELVFSTPFGIDFYLEYITNKGAAWGMLSSMHIPLLLFRIAVVTGLLIYTFRYCTSTTVMVGLSAIIEGAASNIFDCFYFGHVVDMFHFIFWGHSYGIFNLADASIFLGTLFLIVHLSRGKKVKDEPTNN